MDEDQVDAPRGSSWASWAYLGPGPARLWRARRRPGLAARVRGQGQAVVLLHGQPGSAADWSGVAEQLAGDYRVIVPDRLGYGSTGGRPGGFSANAAAVARLLRTVGATDAVVVGHSWGGGVALQAAVEFPHLVKALVLVSSVSPDDRPSRLDRLLARPVLGTALAAATLSTAGTFLSWGPGRAYAGWRLRSGWPEHLAEVARDLRRPSTWASFAVEQRALVHELPKMAAPARRISAPTVVLVGTADKVVPPQAGRRLASVLPQAVLRQVEGAGHLLPQLRPTEVAGAIREAARIAQR